MRCFRFSPDAGSFAAISASTGGKGENTAGLL
jgi:hypothetical protein